MTEQHIIRFEKDSRLRLLTDIGGQYIPVCTLKRHPGIVHNSHYKICEQRDCDHYLKFRAESPARR